MATVVTGGTKGVGFSIAKRLVERSGSVYLNYVADEESARRARSEIESGGATAHLVRADVGTPTGAAALMDAVAMHGESVDHLVHCAVQPRSGPLLTMEPDAFARVINVNSMAVVYLAQAARKLFRRGSSLIFVSSKASRSVLPGYGAVGASKAFAEHLMRYLAVELAPLGVRANCIAPGVLDSAALRALKGDKTDEFLSAQAATNPSGRNITPDDYTALVDFLVSPAAQMIQGQVIFVTGGAYIG